MRLLTIGVLYTALAGLPGHAQPNAPTNLDFESGGTLGAVPRGWTTFTSPAGLAFRTVLTTSGCLQGQYCALMSGPANVAATAFGNLSQTITTANHRGRTAVFRVAVRVEGGATRAVLWLRVDRPDGTVAFILNSPDITSSQWQYYQAIGPVATDSSVMTFGVLNFGSGNVWVDDASFEGVNVTLEDPRPLTDDGLANLTALAKVVGYVRHFHPSDQVTQTDWDSFAASAVRSIETAGTADELATRLQQLLDPIAPTVRIFPTGVRPALPAELQPSPADGLQLIRWNHFGVFLSSASNIYRSSRQTSPAGNLPSGFQDPQQPFEAPIGRGLSVLVPLTLYTDSSGTLPRRPQPRFECCAVSAEDRATRLGSVILAWNVPQHFYPYFDVVETDWPAALSTALRSAATDVSSADYFTTLSRLWAALHDGHGFVTGPQTYPMVPLVWDWVEGQLIVTVVKNSQAQGIARGDRVVRIDGKPAEEQVGLQQQLMSGATPQWTLYRALPVLAQCRNTARTMQLEIEPYDTRGSTRTVQLNCGTDTSWGEPRLDVVQELEPGILYVDINGLTSADWSRAVTAASTAKGMIFDLRGYPQIVTYLQHLGAGVLNSAQWHIPIPSKPDRVDFAFQRDPSWALPRLQPAIGGRRVFLTDGRAVSFAESVMGIVENYRLAEIVGSTTAGTNGNINYVILPGGYRLGFTGMRVLKHDGSQHHGVGIAATIPSTRTRQGIAEGRDEVLARGMEVVKGPQPGPTPSITAVVNAASYAEGPVSPGEIVTIFGTNLGPRQLAKSSYDGSGFLRTFAGETRVFFDEIQAPLVYASNTQVSAIVPYQVTESTRIRVEYQLRSSEAFPVRIARSAPGIFTDDAKSQARVVNQDGTFNSESNAASRGDVVTLFATGSGQTTPAGVTGKLPASGTWRVPAGNVTVLFGGVPGDIQFLGEIAAGVLQVNVRIPATAPVSNVVPLAISIDASASPTRATIAIK